MRARTLYARAPASVLTFNRSKICAPLTCASESIQTETGEDIGGDEVDAGTGEREGPIPSNQASRFREMDSNVGPTQSEEVTTCESTTCLSE